MHGIWVVLFSIASGFTASGIVASVYRILGFKAETHAGRVFRSVVLIVAGPTVVFESAMQGMLKKEWNPLTFWMVAAGLAYWSMAVGLFILDIAIHI